jgi:hypothetical protein
MLKKPEGDPPTKQYNPMHILSASTAGWVVGLPGACGARPCQIFPRATRRRESFSSNESILCEFDLKKRRV